MEDDADDARRNGEPLLLRQSSRAAAEHCVPHGDSLRTRLARARALCDDGDTASNDYDYDDGAGGGAQPSRALFGDSRPDGRSERARRNTLPHQSHP